MVQPADCCKTSGDSWTGRQVWGCQRAKTETYVEEKKERRLTRWMTAGSPRWQFGINRYTQSTLIIHRTLNKVNYYFTWHWLHWKTTTQASEKRVWVLTHETSTQSRFYTYLHDEENRVWRFLEEKRHRISWRSRLSWSCTQEKQLHHYFLFLTHENMTGCLWQLYT